MKKMLWMAALTSVALAGCVNEEVAVDNPAKQRKELMFGNPVMSKQSRVAGEILGVKYPDEESFVVFSVVHNGPFHGWENSLNYTTVDDGDDTNNAGVSDDSPFFPEEGVVVTKSAVNNYWHIQGGTKYYWPKNGDDTDYRMTFAAYSPASLGFPSDPNEKYQEGIKYDKSGLNITNYRMPDNPAKHFDLMYSTRTVDAETSPIAINFKHALASVRFMFVKQAEDTGGAHSINIKKVSLIGNIHNKGDFKQDITLVANSLGNPTWYNLETVMDDNDTPDDQSDDTPKEYVLFDDEFTVPEGSSKEIDGIYSFMVIPQSVNEHMKVKIEYDVVMDADDDPIQGLSREIPLTYFKKPSSTDYISSWHRANRYVYTIQFGALREIFFIPTISEDWVTEGNASFFSIGNVSNPGGVTP